MRRREDLPHARQDRQGSGSEPEPKEKKEPESDTKSKQSVKQNPDNKSEKKAEKSEQNDKNIKSEADRKKERKAITKITIGTVIIALIIAVSAFLIKDLYPTSNNYSDMENSEMGTNFQDEFGAS